MFKNKNKQKIKLEEFETLKSKVENLSILVISLQSDIDILRKNK